MQNAKSDNFKEKFKQRLYTFALKAKSNFAFSDVILIFAL